MYRPFKHEMQQISGRMKLDLSKAVSHQTIYAYIKKDKRNGGELFKLLPHRGKKYKYGVGRTH